MLFHSFGFFFFLGLPCIVVSIHVFLLFFIFFDVWMMLVVFVGSVEFFFIMIHWCVVLSYTAVFNELSFVKVVAVLTVNLICNWSGRRLWTCTFQPWLEWLFSFYSFRSASLKMSFVLRNQRFYKRRRMSGVRTTIVRVVIFEPQVFPPVEPPILWALWELLKKFVLRLCV